MGFLSRFEDKLENAVEGAAGAVFKAPVEPAQIAKRAEKEMRRSKLVGTGRQYAPTLYNVLLAPEDDDRLCGFYPTMAAEIETFLIGCAEENGFDLVCRPLVRFIVDDSLSQSKFEVVAENVAEEIVSQLRAEEMELYGISTEASQASSGYGVSRSARDAGNLQAPVIDNYQEDPWRQEEFYQEDPFAEAAAGYDSYNDYDPFLEDSFTEGQSGGLEPLSVPDFAEDAGLGGAGTFSAAAGAASAAGAVGAASAAAPLSQGTSLFDDAPAPARSPEPSLVNKTTGEVFHLTGRRMSLGRGEQNDIVLRDSNVSRIHAEIAQGQQGWYIKDLGSTNGTSVNKRPIGQTLLHDRDVLALGTTILEFRIR